MLNPSCAISNSYGLPVFLQILLVYQQTHLIFSKTAYSYVQLDVKTLQVVFWQVLQKKYVLCYYRNQTHKSENQFED